MLVGVLTLRLLRMRFASPASAEQAADSEKRVTKWLCAWLFNPMAINMSTRGSADVLVTAMVLSALSIPFVLFTLAHLCPACLYFLAKRRWNLAAVM